jgi:hypothetical protein
MFTLGMATYDDYEGVYFTIQSARLHNPEISEIILIDNNPTSKHGDLCKKLMDWQTKECKLKYIPYTDKKSSFSKGEVFKHATNEYVVIIDCHVLLFPNAIKSLKEYYLNDHKPYDFIQGPLCYDDLESYSTHLDRVWRTNFYGTWATSDSKEKYFEIPAMGMGCFSCKKNEWLGFNPLFKGFGGEEYYIHDKYKKHGGRCICLSDFKWTHRFNRPNGIPFPNILEDRCYNYFIGRFELEMDYMDIVEHFSKEGLNKDKVQAAFNTAHFAFYGKYPEELLKFNMV